MEVKCPKCRFRFHVDVIPGENEVNCVCPRCGTPFMQKLEEDEGSESKSDTSTVVKEKQSTSPSATNASSQPLPQQSRNYQGQGGWQERGRQAPIGPHTNPYKRQEKGEKKFSARFRALMVLIIVSAAIILYFALNGSDSQQQVPKNTPADYDAIESTSVGDAYDDTTAVEDPFKEVRPQPVPEWVKGTWTYKASFGLVTLVINDNTITETITYDNKDGERKLTSSSRYYYQDGSIYCKDVEEGQDRPMFYRLDLAHEKVMFGDRNSEVQMTKQ